MQENRCFLNDKNINYDAKAMLCAHKALLYAHNSMLYV
jgi:hypothetical protein